jgi:hypothetical protein
MLPANVDTPRGRHLQELARRASQSGRSDWPMPTHNDYVLVGAIVVLYSHMDVNLRRIADLADDNNMLRRPWKGKTAKLTMTDIEKAVMSLDWSAGNDSEVSGAAKHACTFHGAQISPRGCFPFRRDQCERLRETIGYQA